jgi:transcriptional regulator with XRE-family HTH domain
MISSIAQRIGKYIAYQKISRREFASRLGYTSSEKINRLFRKDGAKPGFDIVADIANKFANLNVDWLVTGRGEMLKDLPVTEPRGGHGPRVVTMDIRGYETVAYVSLKSREGYRQGYDREEFIRQLPVFSLPGLPQGSFRMFEVGGRSLSPLLADRDRVVGRWSTLEDLSEDQVCVILTRDKGLIIRKIGAREKGVLWIKGNPLQREEFPPFRMEEGNILEIWDMTFLITGHLPELSGLRQQVAELEVSVRMMEERLISKGL